MTEEQAREIAEAALEWRRAEVAALGQPSEVVDMQYFALTMLCDAVLAEAERNEGKNERR